MKVYEIDSNNGSSTCVVTEIEIVYDQIKELDPENDEKITIRCFNMTEDKYKKLPEFKGW